MHSVGGDSAGGALAAACALRARDECGPRPCFQLLVYPATDCRMETASMQTYTDSPLWNAGLTRKIWKLYLRDGDAGTPEYAAPMLARDFSGLPPAYVEVEEHSQEMAEIVRRICKNSSMMMWMPWMIWRRPWG